jgi:hypothetical protein
VCEERAASRESCRRAGGPGPARTMRPSDQAQQCIQIYSLEVNLWTNAADLMEVTGDPRYGA